MSGPSQLAAPRPGEAYIQFGIRLVVVAVDDDVVSYCCRFGNTTGLSMTTPLSVFTEMLGRGYIRRAD